MIIVKDGGAISASELNGDETFGQNPNVDEDEEGSDDGKTHRKTVKDQVF